MDKRTNIWRKENKGMNTNLIMTELREQHRLLREREKGLKPAEQRRLHQPILEVARRVLELSEIGRKQGLLALEEAAHEHRNGEIYTYINMLVLYIVDGTDPDIVEELGLFKYFSTDPEPYLALEMLMSLIGMLAVQAGENPRVVYSRMENIMPKDLEGIILEEKKRKEEEKLAAAERMSCSAEEFDRICRGNIHLAPTDEGFAQLSILDKIICKLDDRSIQAVFRNKPIEEVLAFGVKGLSGEARRKLFLNLSARKADELVNMLEGPMSLADENGDYLVTDEREKALIGDVAVGALTEIYTLDEQGVIAVPGDLKEALKKLVGQTDPEEGGNTDGLKEGGNTDGLKEEDDTDGLKEEDNTDGPKREKIQDTGCETDEAVGQKALEKFCQGGLLLENADRGYFELVLCDQALRKLDRRWLQRVLLDHYDPPYDLLFALGGEGRRCVLENLSSRKRHMAMEELNRMEEKAKWGEGLSIQKKAAHRAAVDMIKDIYHLWLEGEIVLGSLVQEGLEGLSLADLLWHVAKEVPREMK